MKQVIRENLNRIYLELEDYNQPLYTVEVSIFDESGNFAKNSADIDTQDIAAVFDSALLRYYIEVTFKGTQSLGFLRAFWDVVLTSNSVTQDISQEYTPQDLELVSFAGATTQLAQIVPISFFLDNYIMKNEKLDAQYKRAIELYTTSNRNDLSRLLLAAQGNLERPTKLSFFIREQTIKADYYAQMFGNEYWLQQPYNRPLISLSSFKLVYGAQEVDLTTELQPFIIVNKEMGTLQFLPVSTSGTLYQALMLGISALGIAIISSNVGTTIPGLFHYTYKYGLDFPNLDASDKESDRKSVV